MFHLGLYTCRFVCCIMVAIPLAATLFTAIIRWQQKREVSPTVESSCLNSGLNLYGTMKTNGSSSGEINSRTSEENGKYNVLMNLHTFIENIC